MSSHIILDLDNTISDDLWRYGMIEWHREDHIQRYETYHLFSTFDDLGNKHLLEDKSKKIIILTARPEPFRENTEYWLHIRGIHPVLMMMRQPYEFERSKELKISQLIKAKEILGITNEDIHSAYDDREDVVEAYKAHGINAYTVCINDSDLYHKNGEL